MNAMSDALWSLFRNQKAKGLRAAMRQTLQKMERAGLTDGAWYNAMGELALEEKNPALALRFFQQACQKQDSAEFHLNQGHALYAQGDFAEAEKQYQAVLDRNPEDVHALVNRANSLIQLNRLDDAWNICEIGLTKTLARPAFWNTQGQISFLRDDVDSALSLFQRAYREAPDYVDALFNQANAEARLGKLESAIEHFDLCTRKDENYESAFFNLAMLQLEAGKLRDAQNAILKALALNPNSADSHHLQARIHYSNGELKLAREAFRKALRKQEDHIPSILGLARVLTQENQEDEATGLIKRLLGISHVSLDDRKACFSVLLELGQYSFVLSHCDRMTGTDAEDFGLLHTVALWKSGKLREAIQRMEKVLLLESDSVSALTLLGMMLREHGAAHLAEPRLRRALEIAPGVPRTISELAMVYVVQDKTLEAISLLKDSLATHPGHPDLLYNLACAQTKAGNLDDALTTLQIALENGFSDLDRLGHDPDIQSLRQLKAFSTLIGEPG